MSQVLTTAHSVVAPSPLSKRIAGISAGSPTPGTMKSGAFGSHVSSQGSCTRPMRPAFCPGQSMRPVFQI